ncbi:MAG: NADH-quinone oxidoreductase subunit H, partial [SAR324 cluster bacterium]|nr:NADH-quinone oxidoreductase subunit H [SAR324 cluster bacterium]
MLAGTLLTLMERKWMSAVQDRIGPNRANLPGLWNF